MWSIAPLKTTSQAASEAITSAKILVAVDTCSSPALVRYQSIKNLLPDGLLVLSRDAFFTPLLNGGQSVLECVHLTWRAFDSTFAWNACHNYPDRDDFRLFYQRYVRLFIGQNIRTSFGQSQKNGDR